MASKRKQVMPAVEIELDKKRQLVFDFNALCKLEETTGKNALRGDTWSNLSALDVRALLWGALLRDDPDLTLDQVGQFIDFRNLEKITGAIQEAFEAAAASPEDSSEGNE